MTRNNRLVLTDSTDDAPLPEALERAPARSLPARLAGVLAADLAVLGYAFGGWRRRPSAGGFTMHRERSYLLVIGVLAFLVVVETAGLHVALAHVSAPLAWVMTALSAYGLLWIVGDAQAVRLNPVRLAGDRLLVQQGLRWRAAVPLALVATAEPCERRPPGALDLGLLGANVLVTLRAPILVAGPFGLARRAARIAFTVDRRDELLAALAARVAPAA